MSESTSCTGKLESIFDHGKIDMMIKVWETDLNLTGNTDDTSGESYQEEARHNATLTKLILPPGDRVDDFDNEPVVQVFKENGIKTLFDFACLTPKLIDDLVSEWQLMTFLNDAVLGIPNLAPILHLMRSIHKDTGPNKVMWDKYFKEIRTRVMKYNLSECFSSGQNFCGKKHKNPPTNKADFCKPGSSKFY